MDEVNQLVLSAPAHVHSSKDVPQAMRDVIIALIPALIAATVFFGLNAIFLSIVCVLSTCITEALIKKLLKSPVTLWDGSAVVTGLLLAFTLSPTTPWWLAAFGAFIAIAVGKELFGGIGRNIFNPALFGRVFIFILPEWKLLLNGYVDPLWWKGAGFFTLISAKFSTTGVSIVNIAGRHLDGISGATTLVLKKTGAVIAVQNIGYINLFLGNVRGSLGETSAFALLLGAAYLFYKGHINWRIPGSIIGTVVIVAILWGQDPLFHVLAGGLILGTFFMATDWVTSPMTGKGQILYGVGIGLFIMFMRRYGLKPEGVALAILHFNPLSLFIDRYTLPKKFGY
ncbi:MAG: RnfABCDGE type electron transport complex subunit D [Deltaproteobacteria bacterium]|nr:RnfABCDGE type electron transport complex subunit D [Deltaproteobacteria bacterium]